MGFNELTSGLCVLVGDLRYSLVLYSFTLQMPLISSNAAKTKAETQARLSMWEKLVRSQLSEMEHLMLTDAPHARVLSAKYILDIQVRELRAWMLRMQRRMGLVFYQEALARVNKAEEKAEEIATASRIRPTEVAREAAAQRR